MNGDSYPTDVAFARMNQALRGARKVGPLPAKVIMRTRPMPISATKPVPARPCDCCGNPIPGMVPARRPTVELCPNCKGTQKRR